MTPRSLFALGFLALGVLSGCDRPSAAAPVTAPEAMVVTAQREATRVGVEILRAGGNAVDAAVGVGYALAVAHPCCGNLGGGGFATVRLANGDEFFFDFRETAPLAATPDLYLDEAGNVIPGLSTDGYLAVGVPGTVLGLETLRERVGTWPRDRLLAPSIALARDGFVLHPGDAAILARGRETFAADPDIAAIFLDEGRPLQAGDRLVQPDLARTLEAIAAEGADAFYRGAIAKRLVAASRANGGILTRADLATYRVELRDPLRCPYRGYTVVTSPPPGSGATLCQMLQILARSDFDRLSRSDRWHRILSAMLFAFADRNRFLGDPAFVRNPVERLLSASYAAELDRQIGDRAILPAPLFEDLDAAIDGQTTHYSVVDAAGNAVAVTYTINSYFGSGQIAPGTGFFLNNEMDDFTAKPGTPNNFGLVQGSANRIEPGKRPLSSMSPTLVRRGDRLVLVTGTPGGSTIPTTVLQILIRVLDDGVDLAAAVRAPRVHYQGLPPLVLTQPGALPPEVQRDLTRRGYEFGDVGWNWGAAESIAIDPVTGARTGVNDPRRPAGLAAGF